MLIEPQENDRCNSPTLRGRLNHLLERIEKACAFLNSSSTQLLDESKCAPLEELFVLKAKILDDLNGIDANSVEQFESDFYQTSKKIIKFLATRVFTN